eukprot:CAMPEP_0178970874 /NCGR_PEP_ID=MMETSP0789-20121207/19870_1 /TAXON_ID=3005 /ORGANISM="Rhizosolenia setigera, Strain CCMP 1694" /LENGTH=112 /DNA_ID=CAMNT_0020657599 /DNA_START=238 /DNA_END=577 /DNA_ORIENTATION=-
MRLEDSHNENGRLHRKKMSYENQESGAEPDKREANAEIAHERITFNYQMRIETLEAELKEFSQVSASRKSSLDELSAELLNGHDEVSCADFPVAPDRPANMENCTGNKEMIA